MYERICALPFTRLLVHDPCNDPNSDPNKSCFNYRGKENFFSYFYTIMRSISRPSPSFFATETMKSDKHSSDARRRRLGRMSFSDILSRSMQINYVSSVSSITKYPLNTGSVAGFSVTGYLTNRITVST
jgi:hypothetical protein